MIQTTRPSRALAGLATAVALTLTACGQSVTAPSASSSAAVVTLENCGESATFSTTKRIVALTPGMADLVVRLGAGDRLVAVAQVKEGKLPASVTATGRSVEILTTDAPPTREQLLGTQPDLVLSPTTYEFTAEQGYATREQLAAAGASTFVASAGCFARRSSAKVTDLLDDIDNLGRILGTPETASSLRTKAEAQFEAAVGNAKGKVAPTVAQLYIEGDTVSAIGAGVEHSILETAGGKPVFNPGDPAFAKFFAAEVSRETVLGKNPDYIVFTVSNPEHEARSREWLTKNLANTTAVQKNQLIAIPSTEMLPGTWGNIDAVTTINKALYG